MTISVMATLPKLAGEDGFLPPYKRVSVVKKKRTVFLLNAGTIHSVDCFTRKVPVLSDGTQRATVIPNGYKVVFMHNNTYYYGEIAYRGQNPLYRCTEIIPSNPTLLGRPSAWNSAPSGALADILRKSFPSRKERFTNNGGPLMFGVGYHNIQLILMDHFVSGVGAVSSDPRVKEHVRDWYNQTLYRDLGAITTIIEKDVSEIEATKTCVVCPCCSMSLRLVPNGDQYMLVNLYEEEDML
jgi:hypothetical protein